MAKKKTASSSPNPVPISSNIPKVLPPSDKQPKKSTARELLQKVFDGLSAFRNLTSRLVLSKEEKVIVENIETFIITQKQEADKPIGFSSVKPQMLEELDICVGHLDFDMKKLSDIAATRKKEQLASIASTNYLFECIFHTDPSNTMKDSFHVKFSPELAIPEATHESPRTGVQHMFHGVADFIPFLVQQSQANDLDARDIKDLLSVEEISGGNLVVIEVKSSQTAFQPPHLAEAMAQAVTASKHTEYKFSSSFSPSVPHPVISGHQRFIMTDSEHWKFCLYQPETRTCYLSPILKTESHGVAAILTVLEEWLWYPKDVISERGLWNLRPIRSQKV
ncbi:hypothetical protein EYR38_010059 [Pleurotus pulmonarius]|nr:hypothetical protein EYR38_010059 [Pleurotus pulmonarius]